VKYAPGSRSRARTWRWVAALAFAVLVGGPVQLSRHACAAEDYSRPLGPADLAVVINSADPLSVAIGEYYVKARHIPTRNVARVSFDPHRTTMPEVEFTKLKEAIEKRIGVGPQGYALTWAQPYRVGCMSMTSAFAFGVNAGFCATGCTLTRPSPYFNSPSVRPYQDLRIRPAMSIAATDFDTAKQLIDRGIHSDSTFPKGTAYFVTTDDVPRSSRSREYVLAARSLRDRMPVQVIRAPGIKQKDDVLFYFIGALSVPDLPSIRFRPGAIADHLTSFGGMLTDSSQMSSLRWILAGATGSYGTVVEPCSFPHKFPDVEVLTRRYLDGETLLEAYWKSVAMPGQGLFIGEPLAAPFKRR
jgi:uncharacterized protein (TIGR03790 family)